MMPPPSTSGVHTPTPPLFFCRWDYCTAALASLPALSAHLSDHIAAERPVYVPTNKRRRRDDGAWVPVVSDDTSSTIPLPSNASSNSYNPTFDGMPSFDFPSSHHSAARDVTMGADSLELARAGSQSEFAEELGLASDHVDFDAFLRSPSPPHGKRASASGRGAGPVSSTPLSQIPPPTQSQPHQVASQAQSSRPDTQPPARLTQPSNSQISHPSDSSGALVSPPNSAPVATQAPPPSLPTSTPHPTSSTEAATPNQNVSASNQPTPSPRTSLQFGAAEKTTPRRVSAGGVGFDWGAKK